MCTRVRRVVSQGSRERADYQNLKVPPAPSGQLCTGWHLSVGGGPVAGVSPALREERQVKKLVHSRAVMHTNFPVKYQSPSEHGEMSIL